ncbi:MULTISPECIES: hypothetical protein [unclassified Crossiella]|uniref:hypothetical protein n=1 Tax=unclassified Crossiella TaxID=2620835 RepID=UPI00200055CA|nr:MULTISPECIES: hypothetical protein [unclassified Crossiella]MCK2243429.1 hypothetical protein [Crossiella sp. S99.2]MCK2257287.1 hypothetical protein [Crossiella sp. S99.1]
MNEDPGAVVRTLLAAAGLPAQGAELDGLIAGYPGRRAAMDALYAIPVPEHDCEGTVQ